MKCIGKANKYWTLWEVYETTRYCCGEPYKVCVHQYLKNISFDLETAKSKHPDAIVDESLHGTSSWESAVASDKPEFPNDCFQKGQYRGRKVAECKDLDYLHWALGSILYGEAAQIAEQVLTDNGWRRLNEYAIVPPDAAKEIDDYNRMIDSVVSRIGNGERIEFTTNYNPDDKGEVTDPETRIVFVFPEISMFYYAGHEYFLPTINGKAKRVKGKTVSAEVDRYELDTNTYGWQHNLKVYIKSFKVK